jgi:hypothetical protein
MKILGIYAGGAVVTAVFAYLWSGGAASSAGEVKAAVAWPYFLPAMLISLASPSGSLATSTTNSLTTGF